MTQPFAEGVPRPWRIAALMGLSQVANAAGFFYEVSRRRV